MKNKITHSQVARNSFIRTRTDVDGRPGLSFRVGGICRDRRHVVKGQVASEGARIGNEASNTEHNIPEPLGSTPRQ